MIRTRVLAVSAVLVAIGTVAGCSGTAAVSQSDVEKQTIAQLTKTVGQAPDDVTCPGDLEAKVGASETCVLTAGDTSYDVTVTVSSVDDDGTTNFSITVADEPN